MAHPSIVGDKLNASQTAFFEVLEETRPAGLILIGAFAHAENSTKPFALTVEAISSDTLRTSPAHVCFMTMS